MSLVTPRDLKDAMVDWLNREDFTEAQLELFLQTAYLRLLKDERFHSMLNDEVGTYTKAFPNNYNPAYDSSTWISITELYVDDNLIPYVPSFEMLTRERENNVHKNGVWTWRGDFFGREPWWSKFVDDVFDTTDDGVTYEFKIIGKQMDSIDWSLDSSTATWLRDTGDTFLYTALAEASVFLRDLEGVALYQDRANMALDQGHRMHKRRMAERKLDVTSVGGDYNYDRSW